MSERQVASIDEEIEPAPTGFLRRYVFSHDHKVIGRQFLFLGLGFLAGGGHMAMLIRGQLARPGALLLQERPSALQGLFPRWNTNRRTEREHWQWKQYQRHSRILM